MTEPNSHPLRFQRSAEIDRLVARFCDCTLPCAEWTHEAHLTVGLWFIARHPPDEALDRVRASIQRYNAACNTPNSQTRGYHETLTRFYLGMIAIHLTGATVENINDLESLHDVRVANSLLERYADRGLPLKYYSRERLFSAAAKADWVEPNLRPLENLAGLPDFCRLR